MRRSSSPSTKVLVTARRSTLVHASSASIRLKAHGHSGVLGPKQRHHLLPDHAAEWDNGGLTASCEPEAAACGVVTDHGGARAAQVPRGRLRGRGPCPSPWFRSKSLRPSCHGNRKSCSSSAVSASQWLSAYCSIIATDRHVNAHSPASSLAGGNAAGRHSRPGRVGPIWFGPWPASGAERHELESFRWSSRQHESSPRKGR